MRRHTLHFIAIFVALTPLVPSYSARAQTNSTNSARLLERCVSVPDESACRAALEQPISDRQRSLALTYLAETGEEPRDSLLRVALKHDSTNALAHYALASTIRYDRNEGIKHFMKAVALRPAWTHVYRTMAEMYGTPGTSPSDTAVMLWRRAAEIEPEDVVVHVNIGRALLWGRQPVAAEPAFRKALTLDAALPAAVGGFCQALLEQNKLSEAQEPCARAIRGWDGEHGWDLRQILWVAEEAKDYALALAAAERGLVEEPTSSYFRSDRTRILYYMNRTPEADALLRQYLVDHPRDWTALEEIAEYFYNRGELEFSRELYLRLLAVPCIQNGIVCTAKGNLALASLRLGVVDDAFTYLLAALQQQGDCPSLVSQFRQHAQARADSAVLMQRYRRTLAQVGDSLIAKDYSSAAADFFVSIDDWEKAAHYYGVALEAELANRRANLPRGRLNIRWVYGRALVESGRYCEGLRQLNAATEEEPDFKGNPKFTNALARAREQCKENVK